MSYFSFFLHHSSPTYFVSNSILIEPVLLPQVSILFFCDSYLVFFSLVFLKITTLRIFYKLIRLQISCFFHSCVYWVDRWPSQCASALSTQPLSFWFQLCSECVLRLDQKGGEVVATGSKIQFTACHILSESKIIVLDSEVSHRCFRCLGQLIFIAER